MKVFLITICASLILSQSVQSQTAEEKRVDSIRNVLQKKYNEMAVKFDLRNLDTMLSFRAKDFRIYGPTGDLQDYPMSVEFARYFVTNNIPPYHIKNTIQKIKVSPNNMVAVVDVKQESVRKRELAGKLRDVRVLVDQTETWVNHDGKWLLQAVENIRNRKRYVDGKRVSDNPDVPYDPNGPEYVDPLEKLEKDAGSGTTKGSPKLTGADAMVAKLLQSHFNKMTDAFMKDDMLAVAKFYADDAMIVSGKTEAAGRQQVDKYWLDLTGKGRSWKLLTNSIEINNNVAFHDGYSIVTIVQGGKEIEGKSRFLVVWKKQKDGSWKITKDYYSPY
jgi:ketosteroid isomerase-like protein